MRVIQGWPYLNSILFKYHKSLVNKNKATMQNQDNNWLPLESNPEVINTFIKKIGLKTEQYSFQELLSIEQWALEMTPQPVLGIMMLYQCTPVQTAFCNQEADNLNPATVPNGLFYMKQYAQNACGTIALFHIIANAIKTHPGIVEAGSYIDKFLNDTKDSKPEDKGKSFESAAEIKNEHKGASQQGQSAVQNDCDSHFISFVEYQGNLWELDGMKKCPVNHGPCTADELLQKGSEQIKKYMDRDPDNIAFSMIVLAKTPEA